MDKRKPIQIMTKSAVLYQENLEDQKLLLYIFMKNVWTDV